MINRSIIYICLLFGFATHVSAQQNFFNVVSSDITPVGKLFFQQQFNLTQTDIQCNTTLSYGLGKDFEIGLNYFGLNFNDQHHFQFEHSTETPPYIDFCMINAQKRFQLNKQFACAIGIQQGVTTTSALHAGGNYYGNMVYQSSTVGLKCVGGLYYATPSYVGSGVRLFHQLPGLQAGIEKSIIENKWYLQADFISGKHSFGEMVVGTACYLNRTWVLSGGYQIPTMKSNSQRAIVLELTYVPIENISNHFKKNEQ